MRSYALACSQGRAWKLIGLCRSALGSRPRASEDAALRRRLAERARKRSRFGYRRLQVLLPREGYRVNHKRVLRPLFGWQGWASGDRSASGCPASLTRAGPWILCPTRWPGDGAFGA